MKKFAKITLLALGFGVLTVVTGLLTNKPAPAETPRHPEPVVVTNTPLPVQGTVTASINNFPAAQSVSFNGSQPVSFSNTPTTPLFTLDVDDNGRSPFQAEFVLDNTNPGTLPGCGITQCQANFDVPNGKGLSSNRSQLGSREQQARSTSPLCTALFWRRPSNPSPPG